MSSYLELRNVSKIFGTVIALKDVSVSIPLAEVTCILGDNGAGKSTLIKVLSGVHKADEGEYLINGAAVHFESPREALDSGIATVYQDLAVQPLMSIWRNFFLGNERHSGGMMKIAEQKQIVREQMDLMGIKLRDVDQAVGTLSGGERQAVAIARAIYFGAKILILDEPTSALGVKQAGVVLRYIAQTKQRGVGVVFITHNPHHAYLVGDSFYLLNRGQILDRHEKANVAIDELIREMSGGAELEMLAHELKEIH